MESIENVNFHKHISIAVFLSCFIFDAVYIDDTYKAIQPLNLLVIGWVGVIAGYLSWLANPLYVVAILSRKNKIIISLSIASLSCALFFLTKERLVVSEASTTESIVAYGFGYFLWVLSIAILFIGEVLKYYKISNKNQILYLSLFIVISGASFSAYYFKGDDSVYNIFSERGKQFERLCGMVKEEIYKPVKDVKGVFIDRVPGNYFDKITGKHIRGGYGSRLISLVRGKHVVFEERHSHSKRETKLPYVRIYSNKPHDRMPTDKLEANYAVMADNLADNLPKSLGILSYKVYIKSRVTNEIYAETSFVTVINEYKICVPVDSGSYSIPGFVNRVFDS